MKYNSTWKNGYREVVEYAIIACLEMIGQGSGFSLRQFAEWYGFKITPNLRRRLAELVTEGKLARAERYLDNGKLGYWYYAPQTYINTLSPDQGEELRYPAADEGLPYADTRAVWIPGDDADQDPSGDQIPF